MTQKYKIALFGGSFNPPHLGHARVLKYLLNSSNYKFIWVFPVKNHPFDKELMNFEDRLKMCCLGFENLDSKIQVRDDEKNLSGYSIDLVEHLEKVEPQTEFEWIAGDDLKEKLKTWHRSDALVKKIKFRFLKRSLETFGQESSSEIRKLLKSKSEIGYKKARAMLHPRVYEYLIQVKLKSQ